MSYRNVLQKLPGKNFILEITVFVCGALVMIYEIIGSRLLSPYIGASTYVWTSLIGVILGALSLGYWLGGKWADRQPDIKILAFVIFLAGGLVSLTILLKDLVLSLIAESSAGLEIKSLLAALLLFAPASVLLGFVTLILIVFALGIGLSELRIYYLHKTSDLYDIDTEYSRVQVFQTVDPKSGKKIRAIATDPYFIQTGMFLDSDELVFDYANYYHLLQHFKPDFTETLMIGGAGYSFPKDYLQKYPNAKMDVVEIDRQMTEIARRFFRLETNPRLNIIHQDGRIFLNQTDAGKYDAVLMDAFGSLFSVPFPLTTIEAVEQINRVLKDDGVVIFNLGAAIEGDASRFLQAEFKTYQQVFSRVYLFKVNSEYSNEQLQNLIIVACKKENSVPLKSQDPEISYLLQNFYEKIPEMQIDILTDDLAPVEYYNSSGQSSYKAKN
ncbi:MAG: fused MFS/spermidine synthase [Acidobacteria bacterium]|nr:fused MFS/spermidine synthase [Acidobacteriota bacterium]